MNGTYFPNPTFPNNMDNNQNNINYDKQITMQPEQSYIENILRLNIGKQAKIYASYPDSNEWRDRIYDGIIEDAGKDHIIMYSREDDDWYLIPLIYLNWVEFETQINFSKVHQENNLSY